MRRHGELQHCSSIRRIPFRGLPVKTCKSLSFSDFILDLIRLLFILGSSSLLTFFRSPFHSAPFQLPLDISGHIFDLILHHTLHF
ncbi:hypothetical protein K469DRAFT_112641 [Zopfia rhizophila CBS 207.26]|uniref:Uncharacterized protein n=1 Tax=Zopfia rhizophila CBS 207.26 TaxID=1314779 RepID=A0A6A6EC23_9PEZI|nr:hypothetical protein K469DRAFT_112641 [Zopfia rhizophila CBS 207.26]